MAGSIVWGASLVRLKKRVHGHVLVEGFPADTDPSADQTPVGTVGSRGITESGKPLKGNMQ